MNLANLPVNLLRLSPLAVLALGACGEPSFEFAPVAVEGLAAVEHISAGSEHTCAALKNGNLACWGNNYYGQLGVELNGTKTNTPTYVPTPLDPVEVRSGGTHSCARYADGTIDCWGSNPEGVLGFVSECEAYETSCVSLGGQVAGISTARGLTVGGPKSIDSFNSEAVPLRPTSCALLADGTVECWGDNSHGQVRPGKAGGIIGRPETLMDKNGFPFRGVKDIVLGEAHACLIDETSSVYCWGNDDALQAGGYVQGIPGEATNLAAGDSHNCALVDDGEVYCWGENANGQAGSTSGNVECEVSPLADCTPEAQRVVGVETAIGISVGQNHSCAVTRDGDVMCWGSNQLGQLGVPEASFNLPPQRVALPRAAVQVSCGDAHTCALLVDDTVSCWGKNSDGQLGVPPRQ